MESTEADSMINEWHPNEEHEDKLTIEDRKFIFEQAEKILGKSLEVSDLIVSRTTNLILMNFAIMAAFIGFLIAKLSDVNSKAFKDPLFPTCVIGTVYFIYITYVAYSNLKGHLYFHIGTKPSKFFQEHFFQEKYDGINNRLKELVMTEIINYQKRINKNIETNKNRWKVYHESLWMIVIAPIIVIVSYVFSLLIIGSG